MWFVNSGMITVFFWSPYRVNNRLAAKKGGKERGTQRPLSVHLTKSHLSAKISVQKFMRRFRWTVKDVLRWLTQNVAVDAVNIWLIYTEVFKMSEEAKEQFVILVIKQENEIHFRNSAVSSRCSAFQPVIRTLLVAKWAAGEDFFSLSKIETSQHEKLFCVVRQKMWLEGMASRRLHSILIRVQTLMP